MADFEEVFADAGEAFKDAGKDVKKFFKKNPFMLACVGVGGAGLLLWYLRQRNAATSDAYTLSYSGYPETEGDFWQTALDGVGENMDILKDQYQSDLDNLNSAWQDKYDSLLDKLDSGSSHSGGTVNQYYGATSNINKPSSAVDVQSVIDQMKYNSNMALITDGNEDYLHKQNQRLAESIGAAWDERTKTWWYGGQLAYAYNTEYESDPTTFVDRDLTTNNVVWYDSNADYQAKINQAIQNKEGGAVINSLNVLRNEKIKDRGQTVQSANVHYDKNTDYMALINEAKAQGASAEVIENLTQQREAKIRGEKMEHRYNELRS